MKNLWNPMESHWNHWKLDKIWRRWLPGFLSFWGRKLWGLVVWKDMVQDQDMATYRHMDLRLSMAYFSSISHLERAWSDGSRSGFFCSPSLGSRSIFEVRNAWSGPFFVLNVLVYWVIGKDLSAHFGTVQWSEGLATDNLVPPSTESTETTGQSWDLPTSSDFGQFSNSPSHLF